MGKELLPLPEGVNGSTGELVRAPEMHEVLELLDGLKKRQGNRRAVNGDATKLGEVGWGVVCADGDPDAAAALEGLDPLLRRRESEAGARYRVFRGKDAYHEGENKFTFLDRFGAAPGPVNPERMPYYLLLLGSPERIPYPFQYDLDLHHAVGRIHFESAQDYQTYADSVVAAETAAPSDPRRVALFGPRQDEGTRLSVEALLEPLSKRVSKKCRVEEAFGGYATKRALAQLMGGDRTPDLLFTAGHGLLYDADHPRQRPLQGALVCQEWPGAHYGAPEPEHVFAAEDLNGAARLRGLIAFLFACYSAGTPDRDDFVHDGTPGIAAPKPFVSSLAQRLVAGGALAVIGHVERVWRCSFLWRETGSQIDPFALCLERLLDGDPLGWALEPLNQKYADLAASLCAELQNRILDLPSDPEVLAELWTASQDARNYVIVGDPAVRLPSAVVPAPKPPVLRGPV